MQGKTDKTRPSLRTLKKDAAKPEQSKYKPLYGKVFYLDVPSSVISEKLEKDLKELGGVSLKSTDLTKWGEVPDNFQIHYVLHVNEKEITF